MKKRLYVYLGVVAVMVVLVILSAVYESNYRVYLVPEVASIFENDAKTTDFIGKPESVLLPEQTRNIAIDGIDFPLSYNESLSNEMYAYTSEDNRVNCWFDKHSGSIRLISVENWLPDQSATLSEQEYLNWIYNQVAVHRSENWAEYKKSCTTTVISLESGMPQQVQRDGFVLPGENETVFAYVFTFTKMMGEFETSDVIQAYIHPENGFAAVEFSAHRFDNTVAPSVDLSRMTGAIKRFIKLSLDTKKYTYIRHELGQPKFTYINHTLCMICTVSIEVIAEDGVHTVDQQLAIIIR